MNPLAIMNRRSQRGVGLIEVLVAVLVLSFGMLGLVGLQLFTLKNNQSSLERGMAVVQSHSIIDAMRADRANAINDAFDITLKAKTPTGTSYRDHSIAAWRTNLQAVLGEQATGSIDCSGTRCMIVVQWNDERAGGAAAQTVTTEVQL